MPEFPGSISTYGHAITECRRSIRAASNDSVANRQLSRAISWVNWLTAHNLGGPQAACGVIGEIGVLSYKDVAQWAGVMEALYEYYDSIGLSVLSFCATSVEYGISLAQYTSKAWLANTQGISAIGKQWEPLNVAGVNADSTEIHAINPFVAPGGFRGIALANGVNETPETQATFGFSNSRELTMNGFTVAFSAAGGTYQSNGATPPLTWLPYYNYGTPADYAFLASRGVRVVRLAFRWERVNRTLGGALDTTELARIDAAVAAANAVGIQIILDMHNFGNYYLDNGTTGVRHNVNDATVTFAHFTNVWQLLSAHYSGMAGIIGYQLMNEPASVAAADVETMQKNAVSAIRGNGDTTQCLISGGGGGDFDSIDDNGPGWAALHATDFMATTDGNRTLTCSLTSGSTTVTVTTGAITAVDKGRYVTGTNIPAGAQITSVNVGANTFVISAAATATATGVVLTVRGNYLFVADHYLDFNASGTYTNSYATEISNAAGAGHLGFGYPLRSNSPVSNTFSFLTTTATTPQVITGGTVAWAPSITFVCPPSGGVAVEAGLNMSASGTLGDSAILILLDNNGSVVKGSSLGAQVYVTDANLRQMKMRTRWEITGLTPGTTYTYKLAYQSSNVRSTAAVAWGGGSNPGDQGIFEIRQLAGAGYPGE